MRNHLIKGAAALLMGFYCLSSAVALTWVAYTSFKSNAEFFASTWALPSQWRWGNYAYAWANAEIGHYFFNTAYLSALATLGSVLLGAMAAYVLARVAFPFRQVALYLFLAAMMVPAMLYLFPLFVQMRRLHLTNSHLGLLVLYVSMGLPFTVFVLTGFFKTLPRELEEAALIDGASPWKTFWLVMLPLARPGLITVAIFNFISFWNEFFWSLILLHSGRLYTLARGLQTLFWNLSTESRWTELFAGLVIVMLPLMAVFLLLQDRITAGLTVGALKG
jgi:ABC-type glycerol-3-phosphate transport system permease component